MEPFYFNTSERPLFAVYHPPHAGAARKLGIVLCYPMGQEYIRSHRAFVQLARRLSAAGFHCLRFDYSGCGDSAGDLADAGIEQWMRDIGCAIDELRDGVGTERICLIGLRLGATLAALVGARRGDAQQMILWEPVLHGQGYIDELRSNHRERLRRSFANPPTDRENDGAVERLGFPLTIPLADAIRRLDLTRQEVSPANEILLLGNTEESRLHALLEHYRHLGIQADHCFVSAPPFWREGKADAGAPQSACLVPSDVINAAIAWLTKVSV